MQASVDWNSLAAAIRARLHPTQSKMEKVADFAKGQIFERFASGGSSGGETWPPGKMPNGKTPVLYGLQFSYRTSAKEGEATIGSPDFRAYVHHLGTKGQNPASPIPDMTPKRAVAMFVPLTPAGVYEYEQRIARGVINQGYGYRFLGHHMRQGRSGRSNTFFRPPSPAIYGRDFIFLKHASLPARPQLPTSTQERQALKDFVARTLIS